MTSRRTNKLKSPELLYIFENNDIVCLTETWTDEFSDLVVNDFEHYVLNRVQKNPNAKRNSGGIVIYVRSKFVSEDTHVFCSEDDILCIRLKSEKIGLKQDLYILLCYVMPENSVRQAIIENCVFERMLDSIVGINNRCNDRCYVLCCGDFNARTNIQPDYVVGDNSVHLAMLPDDYISDVDLSRVSQDKGTLNNNGTLLLDFCKQTGLRLLNGRVGMDKSIGKVTFVGNRGSSVVDYMVCSPELFQFIEKFKVGDPNIISDHCEIGLSFTFYTDPADKANVPVQNNVFEKLPYQYRWNNDYKVDFIEKLNSQDSKNKANVLSENILTSTSNVDIDSCLHNLNEYILSAADGMIKKNNFDNDSDKYRSRTDSYCKSDWYNEECYEKRCRFNFFFDTYRKHKTDLNRINFVKARNEYKSALRQARFVHDKAKTDKLINARYKNAKLYWNMLKSVSHIPIDSSRLSDFETYFRAVSDPDDHLFTPDEDVLHFNERYLQNEFTIMFEELNSKISNSEILTAIKQLKTNKSAGPDLLLNEFFIQGQDILLPLFYSLFNKVFDIGYFPSQWSEGYIIPLHKKGNVENVQNYRGITLLSTLGKLFTRILNNRLMEWAETYNVYIEAQAGFRSEMSTVDNIFVLHNIITHMLNSGKKLYCAFIDFTKAFDYIVRDNLWVKLIKLGIRGKILNIIQSLYNCIKSKVKLNNELSKDFECILGVRQGESLSPFLFSMFINDLEETFVKSGIEGIDIGTMNILMLLYADDIIVFANTAEELQEQLNRLKLYCDKWKLKINVEKTKVMVFRKGGRLPNNVSFTYDGQVLDIVKRFTYLGVVFTTTGSFSDAQTTLAGQSTKAIFKLNKYLYKFTYISVKHRLELFDKLVTPILNYGSQVWGFAKANSIERVHMKYCKTLLKVKKSTQNDFIYGELKNVLSNTAVLLHSKILVENFEHE